MYMYNENVQIKKFSINYQRKICTFNLFGVPVFSHFCLQFDIHLPFYELGSANKKNFKYFIIIFVNMGGGR